MAVVLAVSLVGCGQNYTALSPARSLPATLPPAASSPPAGHSAPLAPDEEGGSVAAPTPKTKSNLKLHVPKPGSAERKSILDALRVVVEEELDQPVIFVVDRLAVKKGFAWVSAQPRRPNGQRIDYADTPYAEAIAQGAFDDGVMALLKLEDGSWVILEYALGSTDFPGQEWVDAHGASRALLGL